MFNTYFANVDSNISFNTRITLGENVFLLYMNDISECTSLFPFLSYAQDTSLVSHANINDGDSSYLFRQPMQNLSKTMVVNKLSFNVKKDNYMFFSQVRK